MNTQICCSHGNYFSAARKLRIVSPCGFATTNCVLQVADDSYCIPWKAKQKYTRSLQCFSLCLFCTGESYWCVNLPLLACHYQDGLISTGRKSQRFCEKEIIRFLDIEWSCSWCDMLSCSLISLVISDNFTGGTDWFQPSQRPSPLSLTTDLNKIFTTFSVAATSLEPKMSKYSS